MNYKQKNQERQKLIDLLVSPKRIRGIYPNNSIEHETAKFQLAYILLKEGFEVYPECQLKGNGRADLVVIKNHIGYIIEILESESEIDCDIKTEKYPAEFTLVKVNAKTFKAEDWKL